MFVTHYSINRVAGLALFRKDCSFWQRADFVVIYGSIVEV